MIINTLLLITLFFLRRGNQADLLLGSFSFGGLLLGLGARLPPGLFVLLVLLQVLVSLAVALPSLLVVVGVRRRLLITGTGSQSTAREQKFRNDVNAAAGLTDL